LYYHRHEVDHVTLHDAMDTVAAVDGDQNVEWIWYHLALLQQSV